MSFGAYMHDICIFIILRKFSVMLRNVSSTLVCQNNLTHILNYFVWPFSIDIPCVLERIHILQVSNAGLYIFHWVKVANHIAYILFMLTDYFLCLFYELVNN